MTVLVNETQHFRNFTREVAVFGSYPSQTPIGGFAFNPVLAVLFLSLGAGAILQVIWVVGKLLVGNAQQRQEPAVSWLNFAAITAGVLIMYATAFLVKF